jgi:hypothetical protein
MSLSQNTEVLIDVYYESLFDAALNSCKIHAPQFLPALQEIFSVYDGFAPIENVFDPLSAVADVAHGRMEAEEFFFMLPVGFALWPSAAGIDAIIAATEKKVLTPCPGASPAMLKQTSEQPCALCPFCGLDHAAEVIE